MRALRIQSHSPCHELRYKATCAPRHVQHKERAASSHVVRWAKLGVEGLRFKDYGVYLR
jgi:hypothetical protein